MKNFSALWLIIAVLILPCMLDLERLDCTLFVIIDAMAAFLVFLRYNPECFHEDIKHVNKQK